MKRNSTEWEEQLTEEESWDIEPSEGEDLDNDEISAAEEGFLKGYEDLEEC